MCARFSFKKYLKRHFKKFCYCDSFVTAEFCYQKSNSGATIKGHNQAMYANLLILATPARIIGHQVVRLGHLGGFVAF